MIIYTLINIAVLFGLIAFINLVAKNIKESRKPKFRLNKPIYKNGYLQFNHAVPIKK